MQSNTQQYTNHTGGAKGADCLWKTIGLLYGVKTIDWMPGDINNLSPEEYNRMLSDVNSAAEALKRPKQFKGLGWVQRDWIQADKGQAIYAIGRIIPPGETCYQGFVNESGKEVVAGGTGWAVEMGIQMGKPVMVFDMNRNGWFWWQNDAQEFREIPTPTLSPSFTGIGSRNITLQGGWAIRNVYEKTFGKVEL